MKWSRLGYLAVLLLALSTTSLAWAHRDGGYRHGWHRHSHAGLFLSVPLTGIWHHRVPVIHLYPPVVVAPVFPIVYIERNLEQTAYWWYYCPSRQPYYPYVRECPQAWEQVAPQPPDLR